MKAGPHPILASGKVRYVGDHVAVVVAETKEQAKAAAAAIQVSYDVLPHNVDAAQAMKTKAQVHDVAADNRVFNWSIGDEAATDAAFKSRRACDEARHHQQPPDSQCDGDPCRHRFL